MVLFYNLDVCVFLSLSFSLLIRNNSFPFKSIHIFFYYSWLFFSKEHVHTSMRLWNKNKRVSYLIRSAFGSIIYTCCRWMFSSNMLCHKWFRYRAQVEYSSFKVIFKYILFSNSKRIPCILRAYREWCFVYHV